MNEISLHGKLLNIQPSHSIGEIEYDKAELEIDNSGRPMRIPLKFKSNMNPYVEGDVISIIGYCRSYSRMIGEKSKVDIYIFTYFDKPNNEDINSIVLNGTICKMGNLSKTKKNVSRIYFTLANNIYKKSTKITSYLPCVAFGEVAEAIHSNYTIGNTIDFCGRFNNRQYEKDGEWREANEIIVSNLLTTVTDIV